MEQLLVLLNIALAATLIFLIEQVIHLMNNMLYLYSELQHDSYRKLIDTFKEEKKL